MAKKRPFANPFYALLLVVGVAFLLTATSYGVMAFRDVQGHGAAESGSGLMLFLDQHGAWLMAGELAVLAIASFAAMATDHHWTKRGEQDAAAGQEEQAEHGPDSE
jgi:hypothetical protein